MDESKELKIGDSATYKIADKTVTLKPVTLGKMKRAMEAFKKAEGDTFDIIQDHLTEILNNGENNFATREWIGENITLPLATTIISDMRVINGLDKKDFFSKGEPEKIKAIVDRELTGQETPLA